MSAIFCMAPVGCQCRMLPKGLPLPSTLRRRFRDWRDSGFLRVIGSHLVAAGRELEDREARPTGGIIVSQSVKPPGTEGIPGSTPAGPSRPASVAS